MSVPGDLSAQAPEGPVPQSVGEMVRHPYFRTGMTDMIGTSVGIGAWGLVTGVAMVKSGMPAGLAIFMSLMVYCPLYTSPSPRD